MPLLKLLHLEDDPLDAELIHAALNEGGFKCAATRVDTRKDFAREIEDNSFDLILSDYSLPSFDGLAALDLVRRINPDIPFILLSGVLGEHVAIESLKCGATDYVLKHHLERLVPAVDRALREAAQRAEKRHADLELAHAYERERLINQVVRSIRLTAEPQVVKRDAIYALGNALNADRCYYVDYDLDIGLVTIGMDWFREGLTSDVGQKKISDFPGKLDPDYCAGNTQVIYDDIDWFVERPRDKMTCRAMIRAPLGRGPLHSALVVSTMEPRVWTSHEVMVVETVAAQTQAALEAAQARQREQRIATILQDALQPPVPGGMRGLSVSAYMLPALNESAIGGDYYDVFELDTDRYAVVIGDVSGKGLAAAAQVSIVRNMLRALLYEYQDVARSVTVLNGILVRHRLLTGFITVIAAIYDVSLRTLTYVLCGHEPGLIYRSQTSKVELLNLGGPPLAVWDASEYENTTTTLDNGDILALYTDGLSEAGPSRRDMVGTEGLAHIFARVAPGQNPHQIATDMVSEVAAFANGIFRDDVCLLVLEGKEQTLP